MLPTPSTTHASPDLVYEPAEDSFLFLDTLSSPSETAWLRNRFQLHPPSSPHVPLVVELGPGSGVIIAFATAHAHTIFGTDVLAMSVDVNPHACRATRETVRKALGEMRGATIDDHDHDHNDGTRNQTSLYLASLQGDLTAPLLPGQVDVLIFNPPYVPTASVPLLPRAAATASSTLSPSLPSPPSPSPSPSPFETSSHLLALAYAGGFDGMEVTSRLLAQIPDTLSSRGVAYVLFCRGNRPEQVKAGIRAWESGTSDWCWRAETVRTKKGWEMLEVVRIWREWREGPRMSGGV